MSRSATSKRAPKAQRLGKRKKHHKVKPPRKGKTQRRGSTKVRKARSAARRARRPATPVKRSKRGPTRPAGLDPRLEIAVREMNRGRSLAAAALDSQLSRKQLQSYLKKRHLLKRNGRRWTTKDTRPRRVPVMTRKRVQIITVRGYEPARLVGEHHQAAGQFVRTNNIELLKPFRGQTVKAVNGRRYPLETDPNALHRIAAMDTPPFHEIYEITSNT